ncbi:MAG: M20 family metallopeptidase [Synergistaceae bacterium]|uniref:M20 family metallopeptidase n=1 Tax=Aminivibrio sp. TaxID=1872489 RepID=UPI002A1D082B|nr:M20 family metallopeptidase [Synergistaceae bacterium]MDD4022081.1 M20 family metallopeptidase [Synergistaceae bacterium]
MEKKDLGRIIEEKRDFFIDVDRKIWEYAETAFTEFKSADTLCEALKTEGFTVERPVAGVDTAFCGSWGQGSPVIAFLGEYDALSGLSQKAGVTEKDPLVPGENGHGCGHNNLGAGALAAAVAFREYLKNTGMQGTVRYYGCPGEEGGSGKAFMARAGVFNDVDIALTWHPGSVNAVFPFSSLANFQVAYRFLGVSAHAASCPHLGRSALDAVELMNMGVNYLREHVVPEARMHYAITDSGGFSPNVVQPKAEVLYLLRAPMTPQVEEIYERVNDIARGAALMTGTKVEIVFIKACANVIQNNVVEEVLYRNYSELGVPAYSDEDREFARKIFEGIAPSERSQDLDQYSAPGGTVGKEAARRLRERPLADEVLPYGPSEFVLPGSTDVGDVSWNVPTGQIWVGTWPNHTPGHSWQIVSTGGVSLSHKGMLHAGKVLAAAAVDFLHDPELIEKAKNELQNRLDGNPYRCAIPDDVMPRPMNSGK